MSSNKYKDKTTDFTNIYTLRSSVVTSGINTGYKINGRDLTDYFELLGTNSRLSYTISPYITPSSANLSNVLEYNLIDSSRTTSGIYSQSPTKVSGTLIRITGNGNIAFNCNLTNARMILVGGGGGGGGNNQFNGGGGGGGGGVANVIFSINKNTPFNVTLGGGGTAGAVGSDGGNGGDTRVTFQSGQRIIAKGGGGGGRGKASGLNGGNGGGAGSYSNTPTGPGSAQAGTNETSFSVTFFGFNGGPGQFDGNDTGRGGGGGGSGAAGGQSNGGAGYQIANIIELNPFFVAGGGGGGLGSDDRAPSGFPVPSGGQGGGGTGGYTQSSTLTYFQATSGINNFGGGGGGASVRPLLPFGREQRTGAQGGSGVCYLLILQNNLSFT